MANESVVFKTSFSSPQYCMYEDRLETFRCWPNQITPSKSELAEAGMYYTGEGDIVKCFCCNLRLSQWLSTDNAWAEHRKWSPQCLYLKMIGKYQSSHPQDSATLNNRTNIGSGSFSGGLPWTGNKHTFGTWRPT
jgi:hypothetical protein